MDLDHLPTDGEDDFLFGDGAAPAVPPSLLAPAAVMDLAMHPRLPLFAAGLVTGEVEVHEFRPTETRRRPIAAPYFTRPDPDAAAQASPYNLRMHPRGGITGMEFTEDGQYLVTVSSDRTLSVLDCVAERIAMHMGAVDKKGRNGSASAVTALADKGSARKRNKKETLATQDGETSGKNKTKKVMKKNPHKFGISSLNVCDEHTVATGDDDGMIVLWDMRQQSPAHHYHEHGDYVSQMIYFSDIQELVSSSGDTCLGVYDLRAGRIRDYSEKRKDELNCFAFVNNTGVNTSNFIPSIVCGTPHGGLPMWKYGSWRRPYDLMERHPAECESIISFNNPDSLFNHNIILTGACDGLVRVIEMYPVRRNICQLSARDFTYAHGPHSSGNQAGLAIRRQRGHEGISCMRLSHDSTMLAVTGHDNIIDFVDVRFLSDEVALNKLRSRAEQRHLAILKEMEAEREAQEAAEEEEEEEEEESHRSNADGSEEEDEDDSDGDSSSDDDDDDDDDEEEEEDNGEDDADDRKKHIAKGIGQKDAKRSAKRPRSTEDNLNDEKRGEEESEETPQKTERQKRRERAAAVKWLKDEKKKKVNFTFEKRRRRVHGFFGDLV